MKKYYLSLKKAIFVSMAVLFLYFPITALSEDVKINSSSAQSSDSTSNKSKDDRQRLIDENKKLLNKIREEHIANRKKNQLVRLADRQDPQFDSLLSEYQAALKQAIRQNWKTKHVRQPFKCQLEFIQIPGGEVISVTFQDCTANKRSRNSVEAALKGKPLPYYGYELVFQRKMAVVLCHPDKFCN